MAECGLDRHHRRRGRGHGDGRVRGWTNQRSAPEPCRDPSAWRVGPASRVPGTSPLRWSVAFSGGSAEAECVPHWAVTRTRKPRAGGLCSRPRDQEYGNERHRRGARHGGAAIFGSRATRERCRSPGTSISPSFSAVDCNASRRRARARYRALVQGPTGYAINPARDLAPLAHGILPIAGKRQFGLGLREDSGGDARRSAGWSGPAAI